MEEHLPGSFYKNQKGHYYRVQKGYQISLSVFDTLFCYIGVFLKHNEFSVRNHT